MALLPLPVDCVCVTMLKLTRVVVKGPYLRSVLWWGVLLTGSTSKELQSFKFPTKIKIQICHL